MELYSIKEVMKRTTLARATVYRYMNTGIFPRQVKIGRGRVVWRASEVDEWIPQWFPAS